MSSKVQEAIDAREAARGDVKGRPTSSRNPRGGKRTAKAEPKSKAKAEETTSSETPEA